MEQQLHGGLGWQEVDLGVALQGFAYVRGSSEAIPACGCGVN